MRNLIAVAIACLSFSTSALSGDSETVMRGVGARTCGEFGADYKRNPSAADLIYMSWAYGFLSSQNITNVLERKPMRALPETDRIDRAIRQDCDRRPLAPFFEIVLNFFKAQPEVKLKNSN
jgi:hypothetical protein